MPSSLNAKDFGLAQNRERIVIVASKKKEFDFNQLKISKKSVFIKVEDIKQQT